MRHRPGHVLFPDRSDDLRVPKSLLLKGIRFSTKFKTFYKLFATALAASMAVSLRGSRIFRLLHDNHEDEIITSILIQLGDHKWIVVCSRVSKLWNSLARQNIVWRCLCIRLWADKVTVPPNFRSVHDAGQSREAFIGSLLDSKRTSITTEELTSHRFYFRFKRVAGSYWTEKDPFWTQNDPLRISFSDRGEVTGFPWDSLVMRWHFVDETGKACQRSGSFMRVAVNGRCVPTYTITRHRNWGFILQVLIMLQPPWQPVLLSTMQKYSSSCKAMVICEPYRQGC